MTHPTMSKVPQYPRPHQFQGSIGFGVETAVNNYATIVPLITYDEGLGVINSYKSNPGNASFAEYAGAKCYPTSKINQIFAEFQFSLTKEAIQTDKLPGIKFATYTIHTAFDELNKANDEVSTLNLEEVLEMETETTDRQSFALYNGVDMKDGKTNALLDLEVGQEGLDTDLEIEGITWQRNQYYDCLHYLTNGDKLRAVSTGLQWHILTPHKPFIKMRVHQQSNTKYMNPYAFLGLFIYCPPIGQDDQLGKAGDSTDVLHMQCDYKYRFNEFNYEFNHSLQ